MEDHAKYIHLSYLGLLILLGATVGFSTLPLGQVKEFGAYFFALLKSLLILFVFMEFRKEGKVSKLYIGLSLFTLFLLILILADDLYFRLP